MKSSLLPFLGGSLSTAPRMRARARARHHLPESFRMILIVNQNDVARLHSLGCSMNISLSLCISQL